MDDRFEPRADKVADQERKIQAEIDARDNKGGGSKPEGAVQAGARWWRRCSVGWCHGSGRR